MFAVRTHLKTWLTAALLRGEIFGVALPVGVVGVLHRAIQRDPTWSALYDALRKSERALSPSRDTLSRGQRDMLEKLVLAQVEAQAPRASVQQRWVAPAAAFACAALFFVAVQEPGGSRPMLAERGANDAPAPRVGMRVRCVDAAKRAVVGGAEVGPGATVDRLSCAGAYAFSLTNMETEAWYVYAVAVDGSGNSQPVHAFVNGARAIAAGAVDEVLDTLSDARSLAGQTIYVTFSRTPPDVADMQDNLRSLARRGALTSALDRLPVDQMWQARIDLDDATTAPRSPP